MNHMKVQALNSSSKQDTNFLLGCILDQCFKGNLLAPFLARQGMANLVQIGYRILCEDFKQPKPLRDLVDDR